MANIHGMNDFNQPNNNNGAPRQGGLGGNFNPAGGGNQQQNLEVPNFLKNYMESQKVRRDPRKEGFGKFLQWTFCPTLTIRNFIAIITILEIIIYIVSLVLSKTEFNGIDHLVFLGVNQEVLEKIQKDPIKISQDHEVWRLLTAVFFHTGFQHIVSNCVCQLVFGSVVESMVGFGHIMGVYLASGIGGNLFSSYFKDTRSVGASTSINGIVTSLLAMILINWQAMSGNQQLEMLRCILLFTVILMVIFNLLISSSSGAGNVDILGHLGGALAGLFWGMAFFPRVKTSCGNKMRLIGYFLTVSFFVGFSLLLFLGKNNGDDNTE